MHYYVWRYIQYCPDLARHESANMGVLLFCPDEDYLEVKITKLGDARAVDLIKVGGELIIEPVK